MARQTPTNVELDVDGDDLTLTVDLTQEHGRSKSSGKTIVVGTTHGAQEVPGHDGVYISVNVYKYD